MRLLLLFTSVAALTLAGFPAMAAMKTSVKTDYYPVSGRDGRELLSAMDRKGPKHGFLTRAIAQTAYTVNWEIEWAQRGRACRVKSANATLSITYIYPAVSGQMSPALKKRWNQFMVGVRKHEQMHGLLAGQMVKAADKAVAGFALKDDPGCRKARDAVKRRVDKIYAEYEARQIHFDDVEHKAGGPVDRLVRALAR